LKTEINNKPIRIVNREAIRLAKLRAQREGRSAANAASITIIEALNKKRNPGQPAFLDNVIVKDKGDLSSGNQSDKTE
jgi:hypothetical protein